jgi:hypothetical protein
VTTANPVLCLPGVSVRLGPVEARLTGASSSGVLWEACSGRFLLAVPGVGRYLVEDGRTITVDPAEGAEPAEVERFLRGTPLAVAHLQRGTPVLHAATVAHGDWDTGAIVIAGDSSAGKSVLAAALWARGYRVLGDDLAPVAIQAGAPVALPTAGELVLWPDAIEWLSGTPRARAGLVDHPPVAHGPEGQRRRVDVSDRFIAQPCPVQSIWWRGVQSGGDIEVRDLRGAARFDAVAAMASNSRIASALLDRGAYLTLAGSLATSGVPIRKMTRPRGRWCPDELANLVEGRDIT